MKSQLYQGYQVQVKLILNVEALKMIKSRPKYKKVLLVKSVTQLKGEELGAFTW